MALTVQLSDGTKNIDLIFDANSQQEFSASYGYRIQQEETVVNRHRPDAAIPEPTSSYDLPSTLFLTMDVKGITDTRLNKITELKRWVDGADQQALRHKVFGDVPKITVTIGITGATNTTVYDVRWGFVDDSLSYYSGMADLNSRTRQVVVMVRLEPYGAGTDIVLRNDLPSSPHMLEDSDDDGLADGLIEIGSGTAVIDTSRYLIGGQSQRMDFDGANIQGFATATITAAVDDDVVMYVWVTTTLGLGLPKQLELRDGAGAVVELKVFDPSAPVGFDLDKRDTDDGQRWFRYSFISTATRVAANVDFRIYAQAGDDPLSFWIDGLYLQVEPNGTAQPVPVAFSSASSILNRNDPTAANPERINYVDTWGIPGDSLALARWELEAIVLAESNVANGYFAAVIRDGNALASEQQYVFEGEGGLPTSGTWADIVDAARHGGEYARVTTDGDIEFTVPARFAQFPWRVIVVVQADNTATTFELSEAVVSSSLSFVSEPISPVSVNTWKALDLGLINGVGQVVSSFDLSTPASVFSVKVVNAGTNADIDFIACLSAQTDESPMFYNTTTNSGVMSVGEKIIIDGALIELYIDEHGLNINRQNFIRTVQHGDKMQRTIFGMIRSGFLAGDDWRLDDNYIVTLTATPRTRQLLGTQ